MVPVSQDGRGKVGELMSVPHEKSGHCLAASRHVGMLGDISPVSQREK